MTQPNPPSQTDIATEAVTGVPVDTGRSPAGTPVDRNIPVFVPPGEHDDFYDLFRRTTKWTRENTLVLACCVALLAIGSVTFWEFTKALFRWIF